MEPILRTEHLTFTYPGEERPTLGDLSLEIARGSFVAVLGHNGSGKIWHIIASMNGRR